MMLSKLATLSAAALSVFMLVAGPASAAGYAEKPPRSDWTFSGPFGTFDKAQLQRGYKVYREVCASCHSMNLVSFRNLGQEGGPGFTEEQVRVIAAEYQVVDGPDDQGEMFERPGVPADRFVSPFPNEAAARAANGGAYPPDLSVMTKARTYERGFPAFIFDIFTQYEQIGADYVRALLVGYEPAPDGEERPGLHYNRYFPGNWIAMANPLSEGQVTYDDEAPETVEQYAADLTAFLYWAAEPHMETRKRMGFQVMIFLIAFAGLLYFTKKKVWKNVHTDEQAV